MAAKKTANSTERGTLLCGPVTKASIIKAAKDEKRPKESAFLRFIVEEWLHNKGYKIDAA